MTHEPTDNDARIMLHILLTEARRFHSMRPSHRRPVSASRSVMESSSTGNASICSTASINSATAAVDLTPPHCPIESASESEGEPYDGWTDLQSQIEEAWSSDTYTSPHVKYQRLKSYLTCLFIWDPTRDWDEFEDASPASSLEWINGRQQARLTALPPGQLFMPIDHSLRSVL